MSDEERVYDAGWAISTSNEDTIKNNAQDLDHGKRRRKYTNADGSVKEKVWEAINASVVAFECRWRDILLDGFGASWGREEGHDSLGDLVGSCGLTKRAIFNIMGRAESYNISEFVVLANGSQPEGVDKYTGLLHPCVDLANITFWLDKDVAETLTEEYEDRWAKCNSVATKMQKSIEWWLDNADAVRDVSKNVIGNIIRNKLMDEVKEFYADDAVQETGGGLRVAR